MKYRVKKVPVTNRIIKIKPPHRRCCTSRMRRLFTQLTGICTEGILHNKKTAIFFINDIYPFHWISPAKGVHITDGGILLLSFLYTGS